jgi:hypothetical protein
MTRKVFFISVGSSILASIAFAWLLDPITRWVWHATSDNASSWFVHLQNVAFQNAALGKREWLSTVLFICIFGLVAITFFVTPIGMALGFTLAKFIRRRLTDRTRHVIGRRIAPAGLIVCSVFLSLVLFYVFGKIAFLAYVDLQLNASFSQRIDALSPYIEPIEERRLKSQWALMNTRQDYERINRRLEELAVAAHIPLPPPLLK